MVVQRFAPRDHATQACWGVLRPEVFQLPTTRERVPAHTSHSVNGRIRQETEERVKFLSEHPEESPCRLKELDEEWHIKRAIEANARITDPWMIPRRAPRQH
jgi:hypothetical protein